MIGPQIRQYNTIYLVSIKHERGEIDFESLVLIEL